MPPPPPGASICPTALDVCTSGTVEIVGPRECSPTFQSAAPDWCDMEHDCTSTANIGGTQVEVHEWMYTNCQPLTDSQWNCNCGLGNQPATVQVTSPDAWNACQLGATACLDTLLQ